MSAADLIVNGDELLVAALTVATIGFLFGFMSGQLWGRSKPDKSDDVTFTPDF